VRPYAEFTGVGNGGQAGFATLNRQNVKALKRQTLLKRDPL
jgi:hypothetical protein